MVDCTENSQNIVPLLRRLGQSSVQTARPTLHWLPGKALVKRSKFFAPASVSVGTKSSFVVSWLMMPVAILPSAFVILDQKHGQRLNRRQTMELMDVAYKGQIVSQRGIYSNSTHEKGNWTPWLSLSQVHRTRSDNYLLVHPSQSAWFYHSKGRASHQARGTTL